MFVLLSKNSFIFSFFRLLSTVRAGNAGWHCFRYREKWVKVFAP